MTNPLRPTALLAIAVLLTPLAAAGLPVCDPAGHCPMASAAGAQAPCHEPAIQADDCCPVAAAAAPLPAVPLAAAAPPAANGMAALRLHAGESTLEQPGGETPGTPLYTLFRTLLI